MPDLSPRPDLPSRPLRTVFCTRGGLFGALVLRRLRASEALEICAIVRSSRVFAPRLGFLQGALTLVRRCGIAYSLYLLCATTVADLLCALFCEDAVPLRSQVRTKDHLPVHTTRDLNDAGGIEFLRRCEPDLLVSAFFDQRLAEAALAIPTHGCLNLHPSLLPAFAGVDPVLQARLHQAPSIGVTVHAMSAVLDAGSILAQRTVDVPRGASVMEATARLFDAGAELLTRQIQRVRVGEQGAPQTGPGSYQSWPNAREVRALRASGTALMRAADLLRLSGRWQTIAAVEPG